MLIINLFALFALNIVWVRRSFSYLARLTRCFWPPERLIPLSPISVKSPSVRISKSDRRQQASTTERHVHGIKKIICDFISFTQQTFDIKTSSLRQKCSTKSTRLMDFHMQGSYESEKYLWTAKQAHYSRCFRKTNTQVEKEELFYRNIAMLKVEKLRTCFPHNSACWQITSWQVTHVDKTSSMKLKLQRNKSTRGKKLIERLYPWIYLCCIFFRPTAFQTKYFLERWREISTLVGERTPAFRQFQCGQTLCSAGLALMRSTKSCRFQQNRIFQATWMTHFGGKFQPDLQRIKT